MTKRQQPNRQAHVPDATAGVDESDLIERLAERYRTPLLTYFRRRTDPADAEDLVQDVFTRMLRASGTTAIRNTEAFLFQTAANLLRDRGRRRKTYEKHFEDGVQADPASEVFGPERVLQGRETLRGLLQGIGVLSDKTRDIFMLHRLEGMKYAEIADLYGISISAVEKHMIKALACVAAFMAGDDAD